MRAMPVSRALDASLYWICLAVLGAALVDLAWLRALAPVDARLSDAMIRVRAASRTPDPEIVIVDIDDRSLAVMADKVGRFPWPRAVYGEVLAELERQRARAVVMDVELYEPDAVRPEQDQFLNETLAGSTNTFFPIRLLERIDAEDGVRLAEFADVLDLDATPAADPDARAPMQLPFVLDRSVWPRTGLVNYVEDDDGVGRRYWLYRDVDGWRIPSLPARIATALGHPLPEGESFRLDWLGGGAAPHEQIAFSDFYEDLERSERTRPQDEFENDIVIIGSSSNHLRDFRSTPVASLFPGVEILATAIDNLKNGDRLVEASPAVPYALVLGLFAPLFVALRRRWNLLQILALLGVATVALLGAAYVALGRSVLVPVGAPLVFAWLFFFVAALRAYLKEQRAKEQREQVLSRFLDRRLVASLVAEGVRLEDIKSQTRPITILFSDMRGFTALSETRPAEEVVALLNRYFTMQIETVFRHGGTLDKFIGDAIMAFWNAPTDDAQHAVHAVACALDMVRTLERFNVENAASGIVLDIGIGLHTGPAVVGFVGSERKLEYTAIGDTVNLGSRLESETKGRARVLVSAATRDACGDAFRFTDLGSVTVKGRQAAVQVFAPAAGANAAEAA
jgi:adenylate cyclase